MMNTFRIAVVLLVVASMPQVALSQTVPPPPPCLEGVDCETDYCFFALNSGGFCYCNPDTNAGCEGTGFCVFGDGPDAPPSCVGGGLLLPTGSPCDLNEQCATMFCAFQGLGPGNPGTCSCDPETNFDCGINQFCAIYPPGIVGAIPQCLDPLPIGAECEEDAQCESFNCPTRGLPPGSPLLCACNLETNVGCAADEVCLLFPIGISGSGPECFKPLPIGAECEEDAQCETLNCYFINPTTLGACACNEETNAGCGVDGVCLYPSGLVGATPQCYDGSVCMPWSSQSSSGELSLN